MSSGPTVPVMAETRISDYAIRISALPTPSIIEEERSNSNMEELMIPNLNVDMDGFITAIPPASAPLVSKLVGDITVAVLVTFGVSPLLTVIDKSIVESANGNKTLLVSANDSIRTMIRHPIQYLKSPTFLLMWAVYSATYSTANSLKTLEEHQRHQQSRNVPGFSSTYSTQQSLQLGKVGTFLGTTVVNSGASILKDRAYARMFSANTVTANPKLFPRATYAMWMMRDLTVIGSSFLLPDMVSTHLINSYGMQASNAQSLCQLTIPVAAQFVAGPFHFLALDFYNRQYYQPVSWKQATMDRIRKLHQGIGPVVAARIARIAPGYGMGGVCNTKLRAAWREALVQQKSVGEATKVSTLYSLPNAFGSMMK